MDSLLGITHKCEVCGKTKRQRTSDNDNIDAIIDLSNNKSFILNKIYLDAHAQEVNAAGETYPIAKNQFDNLMNNGVLFMSYSGHGGYNNITNELFMKSADIKRMNNRNQAFWFLATCSFSHFDSGTTSAGEEAVLNPIGGAIGVLSFGIPVGIHQLLQRAGD